MLLIAHMVLITHVEIWLVATNNNHETVSESCLKLTLR
jgi:hypothetical protein